MARSSLTIRLVDLYDFNATTDVLHGGFMGAPGGGHIEIDPTRNSKLEGHLMRMVKSLLLGSAAGLVAVAGAQAADLPVKAKPVEYVKVCSLYGAGFWYVPGTDTCLKIGSFVRVQTSWNTTGSDVPQGAGNADGAGRQTRTDTANFGFRVRSGVSVDLRTQTEYGTLRSYMDIGAQWSAGGPATADNNA